MLITASCLMPVLSACFNSELWHLCILHACSSRLFLLTHPPGFEMAVVFEEGSFSNQADLTVHLSSPPFHLLTLLMMQVGKNWVLAASRGRNLLGASCKHCASTKDSAWKAVCSCWGMGTLDLSLMSRHNKGTLLESDAAIGQSRAVSWPRGERTEPVEQTPCV